MDKGGDGMKTGKVRIRWRSVVLGTATGVLILVCASAGAAGLMAKGAVASEHMDLFAAGILALAALGGALTAMLGSGSGIDGALTAAGELVVLLALNAGLNGGKMEGIGVTILLLAGGCGGAMLLRLGGRGSGQTRRRRRRNR